jgi:chemotaxis protein MotB
MKLARWGLVATVVLGAVITSGCNTMPKVVTSTTYDHWMTLDAYTKKQAAAITAYIEAAASHEATREALARQLEDLKSKTGDNAQMLVAYKTARDDMAKRLQGTEAERKRLDAENKQLLAQVTDLKGNPVNPGTDPKDNPGDTKVIHREGRIGIRIPGSLLFSSGSATLTKKGVELIGGIAKMDKVKDPTETLSIEGHTDSDKVSRSKIHFNDNYDLSAKRAHSVMKALAKAGVSYKRMQIVGHGPNQLILTDGKESKAKSRRVEIFFMRAVGAE